jgi:hypothetical protein
MRLFIPLSEALQPVRSKWALIFRDASNLNQFIDEIKESEEK